MGRGWLCVLTPLAGLLGPVVGQENCQSCYHLASGTIVGIIVGDIILTLLIALSVFCFVSRMKKNHLEALQATKGNISMSASRKVKDDAESTYQDLQGVRNDIYSDLRRVDK
ncbi:TYRO protein tyrosine kinase-binding protein [Lepisosteus oculatus]|uniref:TYRO protein tyrosine kinase-binding protein n=1 Tax=Lepisosteus oculatus TaxID=7918 RepID=UPI0007402DA4|nr:PREDICTED: TYRO protein tyrosine kinase-binding protein-like [Lepisosteus oculatus]